MIYVFIKQDISTMKQKFSKASLLLASVLSISFTATSQLYVKNRPSIPVIIRIPQPSPNHIWIDEEWDHNHDVYRYAGGHWELPQSVGDSWRHGHWKHTKRGDVWVHGYWNNGPWKKQKH